MITKPEILYIDLLKKALSFTLWDEPPYPITNHIHRSIFKRTLIAIVSKVLAIKRLQIVQNRKISENERIEGSIWPGYAHTMIGIKRLDNLQFCIETIIKDGVEGDLIETGVWRGGACIFMRGVLAAYKIENRRVFVADSFEGLPKPDNKYPSDKDDMLYMHRFLSVSKEEVEKNFEKYGLLDEQVVFLKGWFKDTLPKAPIEKLSILRLDGDMYESTMDALNNLYPKLSKGGFCIIDDYGCLENCKEAVDDYRNKNRIDDEIKVIDWSGIYWRKS